jgi:glyoxylase-like metal-dependent hydrolase (beta-lactamase superfamily II)
VLIDPGDEDQKIIQVLEENNLQPIAIINTHAHLDHIGAVAEIKERYTIPFYLHIAEKPVLESYPIATRMFGLQEKETPSVDKWIESGGPLKIGPFAFSIIETPGHTPGGCSYVIEDCVFVGDTLFQGSIGRTDLPGGDWPTLENSLVNLMTSLDLDIKVYSGHGPATSLRIEKEQNPFLIPLKNRVN